MLSNRLASSGFIISALFNLKSLLFRGSLSLAPFDVHFVCTYIFHLTVFVPEALCLLLQYQLAILLIYLPFVFILYSWVYGLFIYFPNKIITMLMNLDMNDS